MFWLLAICACGSSQKRTEVMPDQADPAWATEYATRADGGCACDNADCLERVHRELATMLAEHGGIDDAPPSVHEAHGKFDQCWRGGTKDMARDFEYLADKVCACATHDCLVGALAEVNAVSAGKYGDVTPTELATNTRAQTAATRMADCYAKMVMPPAVALELFTSTSDSMCACKDFTCAQAVMKQREAGMAKYLDIDPAANVDEIKRQTARWCDCMEKVAVAEIKDKSPAPSLTSVSVDLHCR